MGKDVREENLRGEKALEGKDGEGSQQGKGGKHRKERERGGKGLWGDLNGSNRERGAKIIERKGGKGTIPEGRKQESRPACRRPEPEALKYIYTYVKQNSTQGPRCWCLLQNI